MFPAIIGAVGGLLGGLFGNDSAAEEAAKNRAFQKDMALHKYQYAVNDMRHAGLNPILAAGNVQGSIPTGATAAQQNPASHMASSALAFKQAQIAERQQKNQDMLAKSQAMQNSATAQKELASAGLLQDQLSSGYYGSQVDLWRKQGEMYGTSAKANEATAQNLYARTAQIAQEYRESEQRVANLRHEIGRIQADAQEARSAAARNAAQSRLYGAQEQLQNAMKRSEIIRGNGLQLDVHIKRHGLNKHRLDSLVNKGLLNMVRTSGSAYNKMIEAFKDESKPFFSIPFPSGRRY